VAGREKNMAGSTEILETLSVEEQMLQELRTSRRAQRSQPAAPAQNEQMAPGERIADWVASAMGSWTFIITQTVVLAVWIVLNVAAYVHKWDPYPFILLNLALSFEAAYAAPFIMMSQNRQQSLDRQEAANDYQVNIKAELEIELLHQKLDELRQKEIFLLTQAVADLASALHKEQRRSET